MLTEKLKQSIKRIFPGESLREMAANELKDAFATGEFRKEFLVMVVYSSLLVMLSVPSIMDIGLAPEDVRNVYLVFASLGAYYFLDDFFRRKRLVSQPVLFAVDSVFYMAAILAVTIMTGGYDSPVRFFLFFLTAVSAPLYGTFTQVIFLLSAVIAVQISLYLAYHGFSGQLLLALLESLLLMATAIIIKISVTLYQKKADDYRSLSVEQEILYKEAQEYNVRLEMEVAKKTNELTKMLEVAEGEKISAEKQRIATLNILEDMAEAREKLEMSKTFLEIRQSELEAIAELSGKLTSVMDVEKAVGIIDEYLCRFMDYDAVTFLLPDIGGKSGFMVMSRANKAVSRKAINLARKEIAGFMLDNKAVTDKEYEGILKTAVKVSGPELAAGSFPAGYAGFVLPLRTGERIFGALHIVCHDPELCNEKEKKEVIGAIISTASVALAGLEQTYKSQQSKTKSLVHSLSNGIIMFNNDMEVVLVNPAAAKFCGIERDGTGLDGFFKAVKDYGLKQMIKDTAVTGKGTMIREAELNGRVYEIYVNPVNDFKKVIMGVALIIHDITQIKAIDQMKSEFVSVASHQLRTPLTAIRLFIEMLMRGDVGALVGRQKEYLNNIYESTDRMARLVNNLLNVTRIESNRMQIVPEPTSLEELIGSVVEEARPLAQLKKCRISFSGPEEKTPLVPIDRSLFRQVVHNLVTNAIKYSRNRGKVGVALSLDGKDYVVAVSDSGIGIPEKFKDKIFQKFSRADNAVKTETEGTGLGLYVSRKIAESFAGKIWFESKEGKGSTFYVKMPSAGMKPKAGERGLAIS